MSLVMVKNLHVYEVYHKYSKLLLGEAVLKHQIYVECVKPQLNRWSLTCENSSFACFMFH